MANFNQIFMKNLPEPLITSQSKEVPKSHFCHDRGKIYKWQTSMLKNRRQECFKEPRFQSPRCLIRTKQKGNLLQHIKAVHGVDS
jgi:hypothetical protein